MASVKRELLKLRNGVFVGRATLGKYMTRMRHEHHAAQLNNISSVATIVSFPCYKSRTGSIDGVGAQQMNTYLVEWLDRMKWRGERGCGPNH